ncbi:MAG: hypothetical protein A3K68_06625 [Euryarchaeota archaeon RBG_16_68_13]|nr:MAG: hypothetical protein A3K68_06625 [Euryarchaeota archaeon RBG_16_68_13]
MLEARTPDEFREAVLMAREPTVVLFWATWCPFCQRFRPEFDRLSEELPVRFVSVYLDDESNPLWEDFDVEVVPTMALFQDGKVVEREGGVLGYGIDRARVRAFAERVASTVR